jgi:hypothetical protein
MSEKPNKKKPPKDINQLAAYIVQESTKEVSGGTRQKNQRPASRRG